MNHLRSFILFTSLTLSIASLPSCGTPAPANAEEAKAKEYASAYVCPMRCKGSGSEEAGICPVCKMDYVVNEDIPMEESDHDGRRY